MCDFDRPVEFEPTAEPITGAPLKQFGLHPRLGRFMHRADSRLTLTVTDVRVQRLQNIRGHDAVAEGVPVINHCFGETLDAFRTLWDSINGAGAWGQNPWVAAYSFTVQHGNIDAVKP